LPYQIKYKETLYNEEWVKKQYLDKEKSTIEIAKEIGCNRTAVNGALKKFGITARGKISKYELLRDKEWLKNKYVDEQLTLRDIAKLSGSTVGNVHCHLETMGLELRDPYNAHAISDKYKPRYGSDSNFWKDGIAWNSKGRKWIKCREHPMAMKNGYITWERNILEEYYGEQLELIGCQYKDCTIDFVLEIHHIDGNRENDNVDNLVILCPNHHKAIERKVLKENYDVRKMVSQK